MSIAARFLMAFFLAVALAAPALCQADNGPSNDELLTAIQILKNAGDPELSVDRTFKSQFTNARLTLARNPDQSLDLVIGLLRENDIQMRLNAALTLAEMTRAGHVSNEILDGLAQCMRDSNYAIVYWGLMGLSARDVPDDALKPAIIQCVDMKYPQILRMTAATIARDRNMKPVLPWLVEYLKKILPAYDKQVKKKLTVPVKETTASPRDSQPAHGAAPGPVGKVGGGLIAKKGAFDLRNPHSPVVGKALAPRPRPDNILSPKESASKQATTYRTINPDKEYKSSARLEKLAMELEADPAIAELHALGFIIEELAKDKDILGDEPFGEENSFEVNPPWRLRDCAEAAIAWMEAHKDEFSERPEAAPTPAASEADEPGPTTEEVITPPEETDETGESEATEPETEAPEEPAEGAGEAVEE